MSKSADCFVVNFSQRCLTKRKKIYTIKQMGKIKTDIQKRLKPKKQLLGNKTIVLIKITTACILLLGCALFFFLNMQMFLDDFLSIRFAFPIVFFAGLIWVCIYIVNLAGHIDDKNLHHADRFDWLYKIVFILTVLSIVVRSILKDFGANWPIIVICIVSGILTLITPRIVDNNNNEF